MYSTKVVILLLLTLIADVRSQAQCPGQMDAEVLILGAGMAGLGAAETLSKNGINNFLIIDQRDKIGGRVQTEKFGGGIVELGPQWVIAADRNVPEDMQNPLLEIVRRCNITVHDLGGRGLVSYNRQGESIALQLAPEFGNYQAALAPDVVQRVLDALPEDEDLSFSQGLRIGGWNPRTQLQEHVEHNYSV